MCLLDNKKDWQLPGHSVFGASSRFLTYVNPYFQGIAPGFPDPIDIPKALEAPISPA